MTIYRLKFGFFLQCLFKTATDVARVVFLLTKLLKEQCIYRGFEQNLFYQLIRLKNSSIISTFSFLHMFKCLQSVHGMPVSSAVNSDTYRLFMCAKKEYDANLAIQVTDF